MLITVTLLAKHFLQKKHDSKAVDNVPTLKFEDGVKVHPYVPPKSWFERLYLNWELRDDVLNDGLASYSPPGWGLRIMKEVVIYYTPGLVFLFCAANDLDVVIDTYEDLFDLREEINEIIEETNHV